MKAYHIYLLRNGRTAANEEGRYIGRTDLPLSAKGAAQLEAKAQKGGYPEAMRFYSSPLLRCTQSLALLYPGCRPELVPALGECDFGDFEGRTIWELKDDENYRRWIDGGAKTAPPHGESAETFQRRCCAAFENIVEALLRSGTTRAVVMAHGGTIMMILGAYGYPKRPLYEWTADYGAGYEAVVTPQLWMAARAMEIAGRLPYEASENTEDGSPDGEDEQAGQDG